MCTTSGAEALHHRAEPATRLEPDAEVGVERQAARRGRCVTGKPAYVAGPVGAISSASCPSAAEVLQHPADGVGDAVDLRQERLGDDQHAEPARRGAGARRSGAEGDDVGRDGAAATPPLEQVHGHGR